MFDQFVPFMLTQLSTAYQHHPQFLSNLCLVQNLFYLTIYWSYDKFYCHLIFCCSVTINCSKIHHVLSWCITNWWHCFQFFNICKRISAFKTWWKNQKIRKSKFCSLFGLNVFFNVLTLTWKKYQYLSSYNLSFRMGVLCLHWNSLRLSPAPTFRALKKYERSDVTFSYKPLLI